MSPEPQPSAIVGAVEIQDGTDAVGRSGGGRCAEQDAVDRLGGDPDLVLFSAAVRPRTGYELPVCRAVCQVAYAREQFDDGVAFDSFKRQRGRRYADAAAEQPFEQADGQWFDAGDIDDMAAAATVVALRAELSERRSGVEPAGTRCHYADGWLRAYVDICDPAANLTLATIRIDLTDRWLTAGWCSATRAELDDDLSDALGGDLFVEQADKVARVRAPERAAQWLVRQLDRPVVRLDWRHGDGVAAQAWMLADSDRMLVERGDWQLSERPDSRDAATLVRGAKLA
ncbi:hypothetical protein [Fodinicola acaciae]|uniref:hypothetical protein n=1 Tax=Fodinicola acaciae TaxID=2681555 RepID=UPI0013D54684|nr:hypothetical protein [Fodinicola acaciae]